MDNAIRKRQAFSLQGRLVFHEAMASGESPKVTFSIEALRALPLTPPDMRVRIRRFNENNAVGTASDFPMPCAGNGSALRTSATGFTCFVCSPVSLSESFCFLPCSALPDFQSNGRSPQERTLTFPALLPYLLFWLLVVLGFVVICQLAQPHSLIGFVCLRSQVCFQLPPDPASRRRLAFS